jgi:anti-sigma factor RsiW
MTCDTSQALLLTADPAELAGSRETELSRHLAQCARCRSRAAVLLAAQAELAALLAPPAGAVPAPGSLVAEAERRRARAQRIRVLVPLATAAGLVALLLWPRAPGPGGTVTPRAPSRHLVSVTAPPGRSVAVLNSDTTDIVVIWFFQ